MSKLPGVTLILSTFNRPQELKRFLDMIKMQTHKRWELIVCDESPEGYGKDMCFGRKNVDWWHFEHANDWGQTAKEKAIGLAAYDIIGFTNDDAVYRYDYFEKLVSGLEEGADFAYCDMLWNGKELKKAKPKTNHIDVGGFLVRKKFLEITPWEDKGRCGDGTLVEALIENGAVPIYIEEPLYEKH